FNYTVSEGDVSGSGSTTINLAAVNDAPVATAGSAAGLEDSSLPISLGGTDVDSSISGVTIGAIPAGSTLLLADGVTPVLAGQSLTPAQAANLLFHPAPDFNGGTGIVFTVTDDSGAVSAPATLGINVTAVNDAPVAVGDIVSTPINTPVTFAVLGNDHDVEGSALTVGQPTLADPTQGSIALNADGTLSFTPAANVSGPVSLSYTVTDDGGLSDSATVTINVGANTAPRGADSTGSIAEDTGYTLGAADFGFSDPDAGQSLASVRVDVLPAAGALLLGGAPLTAGAVVSAADIASGALVFMPAADGNGAPYASFSFSVQDSGGAFDTTPRTLTIDVTPTPDAAVIGGQVGGATTEDSAPAAAGTLTIADPDAGEAAFVAQNAVAGAHGSFSIDASGAWSYALNNADPAVQALG